MKLVFACLRSYFNQCYTGLFKVRNNTVVNIFSLGYCMVVKTNFSPFLEKVICRCNLLCRDGGHFHCPFCGTTIIRKDTMTMHLIECKNKCDKAQVASVPPSQPPSPETHAAVLSVNMEHSYFLHPSVSAVRTDHCYVQTASLKTPAVATDQEDDPEPPEQPDLSLSPTTTTSEDAIAPDNKITEDVPPTHVNCPHCPLVLYKKNLFLHVKRKHSQVKDALAEPHLKSTCIDQRNSLYAVRTTSRGFSVPVHVQRKTGGEKPVSRCEMEDCRIRGLAHGLCHHIRSLDYCDTTASEEQLDQQVLQEMVENHFFTDSKTAVCKTRQREAEEARVPLSVLVDLTGSQNYICLSIHEGNLHPYSTLGRLFVTHNITKNSWHCPCTKPRASCTHKYIAKWHLFQTHKHLFRTATKQDISKDRSRCCAGEKCEGSVRVQKNT